MPFCPSCGFRMLPAARFCTACGTPAADSPAIGPAGGGIDPFDYLYDRTAPLPRAEAGYPGGGYPVGGYPVPPPGPGPRPAAARQRGRRAARVRPAAAAVVPVTSVCLPAAVAAPATGGSGKNPRSRPDRGAQPPGRSFAALLLAAIALAAAAAVSILLYLHGGQLTATAATGPLPAAASQAPVPPAPARSRQRPVRITAVAAAQPGAGAAARLLARYFRAIDQRDYPAFRRLLAPGSQAPLSRRVFLSRYAAATDTGVTVDRLVAGPGRDIAVWLTYTSGARPAGHVPAGTGCLRWQAVMHLAPAGHSYRVEPPPGYRPVSRACP